MTIVVPGIESPRRALDPMDRLSEIVFGLIMAMTFTGAISVARPERDEARILLIGAIGCNLAWGIIDACMYLVTVVSERGRDLAMVRTIRGHDDPADARRAMAEALPPLVASLLPDDSYRALHTRLSDIPALPDRPRLTGADLRAAITVFLLVFLSTFPLVVPFLLIHEPLPAVRLSHAVGVLMLFLIGRSYGRIAQLGGGRMGLGMVGLGLFLVVITIALGG